MLTIKSIPFFYQEIYGLLENCSNGIWGKTPLIRNPIQVFTYKSSLKLTTILNCTLHRNLFIINV